MKKIIALGLMALMALLVLPAGPAQATGHQPETKTMTWYLPQGVDPHTAPFASWFPQTAVPRLNVWCQVDTYAYDTPWQRKIVDALDDDGLLTLKAGVPEDSKVYRSHTFTWCNPGPTSSPSPTPTPTEPEPTETPTPTPSETPTEPEPTPSETPTRPTITPTPVPPVTHSPRPTSSETPSETVTPTAHSTTSPPPTRPKLVQTDAPAELAQTGTSPVVPLMLAGVLLAVGAALVAHARRTRKH